MPTLSGDAALINRLIGKLIYLYILIDRRVVDQSWIFSQVQHIDIDGYAFARDLAARGVRTVSGPTWPGVLVWTVLDAVDIAINGSVFPIAHDERERITDGVMHKVHRVIRCGDEIGQGGMQISFLDVAFEVLRTETVSAIYEQFLKVEDERSKAEDGAFYTPPFLADYIFHRLDAELAVGATSRVIDPSAGSGIFLVAAFRHLLNDNEPATGWSLDDVGTVRGILSRQIFGIERNSQASKVCRFSLYLTMLDCFKGANIEDLRKASGDVKLFPDLNANVITTTAFDSSIFPDMTFTHVVGNPPWGSAAGMRGRYDKTRGKAKPDEARDAFDVTLAEARLSVGNDRLSDRFVWLARERLLAPGGVMALALPTKSLVGRRSGGFAGDLAHRMAVRFIGNLTHLRYRLFSHARAPACLVVARKLNPRPGDRVIVHRPMLSSIPTANQDRAWTIVVSESDRDSTVRVRDLQENDNGWFAPVMLRPLDRSRRSALMTLSAVEDQTIGGFLRRSGLDIKRGETHAKTGAPMRQPIVRNTPTGQKSKPNAEPIELTKQQLDGVFPAYRQRFSPPLLLMSRDGQRADLRLEPWAFTSTQNSIHLTGETEESRADGVRGLAALSEFLGSGVMTYLRALFGATYLINKERFESGDLRAVPIPYRDIHDERLHELIGAGTGVDQLILDHFGAGEEFTAAVGEFKRFAIGFADGQLPLKSYSRVEDDQIKAYVDRLARDIATSVDRSTVMSVRQTECEEDPSLRIVEISFGDHRRFPSPALMDSRYIGVSSIDYDHAARVGRILKPISRHAWTMDHASGDSRVFLSHVMQRPFA